MVDFDEIVEAIGSLIIIFIFLTIVLPALAQATNADFFSTLIMFISFILIALAVVLSLFRGKYG